MNLQYPVSLDATCDVPGGGGGGGGVCPKETPAPALGPYSSVPVSEVLLCRPAPIVRPNAGCVGGDCNLLTPDGSSIHATEVLVGTKLQGFSSEGVLREQTVVSASKTQSVSVRVVFSTGELRCSESHAVFITNGETVAAGALKPGDRLLMVDFGESEVLKVEDDGSQSVYCITCDPDHTFFAQGVASHNRKAAWPTEEAYA